MATLIAMKMAASGEHLEAVRVTTKGYREAISFGAFAHGRRNRSDPDKPKSLLIHHKYSYDQDTGDWWNVSWPDEYAASQRANRITQERHGIDMSEFHPDPHRDFDSAYEFYEYAGYDRKTKRFPK